MPPFKNAARNTPPPSIPPSKNTARNASSKKRKLRVNTKARRKFKDNALLDLNRAAKEYNPILREKEENNFLTPIVSFYSYSRRYSRR